MSTSARSRQALRELLVLIRDLRLRGLTGMAVMINCASRRLQSWKECAHFVYEYGGLDYGVTPQVFN
jgi:hypothetical protein